jgi:nucleotide-binding universal stress UspA family protein
VNPSTGASGVNGSAAPNATTASVAAISGVLGRSRTAALEPIDQRPRQVLGRARAPGFGAADEQRHRARRIAHPRHPRQRRHGLRLGRDLQRLAQPAAIGDRPSRRIARRQHRGDAGADLIIVGTKGLGGLQRVVLGSVAERIAREAGCSVEVARPKAYDHVDLVAIANAEHHESYRPPHRYTYTSSCLQLRPDEWPLY